MNALSTPARTTTIALLLFAVCLGSAAAVAGAEAASPGEEAKRTVLRLTGVKALKGYIARDELYEFKTGELQQFIEARPAAHREPARALLADELRQTLETKLDALIEQIAREYDPADRHGLAAWLSTYSRDAAGAEPSARRQARQRLDERLASRAQQLDAAYAQARRQVAIRQVAPAVEASNVRMRSSFSAKTRSSARRPDAAACRAHVDSIAVALRRKLPDSARPLVEADELLRAAARQIVDCGVSQLKRQREVLGAQPRSARCRASRLNLARVWNRRSPASGRFASRSPPRNARSTACLCRRRTKPA